MKSGNVLAIRCSNVACINGVKKIPRKPRIVSGRIPHPEKSSLYSTSKNLIIHKSQSMHWRRIVHALQFVSLTEIVLQNILRSYIVIVAALELNL